MSTGSEKGLALLPPPLENKFLLEVGLTLRSQLQTSSPDSLQSLLSFNHLGLANRHRTPRLSEFTIHRW